jgi:hypothetical protein
MLNRSSKSTRRGTAAAALALCFVVPALSAQDAAAARPKYAFLRQDENWSGFRGGKDCFDPLKNISLSDDGETWVSFGGRVESRVEFWSDFAFGTPPNTIDDDSFLLFRALVHADLHLGDRLRLFAEGKTAQATGRDLPGGERDLDRDTLDLQQLFAETTVDGDGSSLRVRFGRQMLSFGKDRLVSPLPWGNTLRTWDGIAFDHFAGPWRTTALFTAFAPVDQTDFNEHESDQLLYGIYARRVPKDSKGGVELYWLGTTKQDVMVNGTVGDSKRHTFGGRAWTPFGAGFDVEAEAAWQGGSVGTGDVHAAMMGSELGYKVPDCPLQSRLFVGADFATGDNSPGGDVETFDQLFPLGHAYFGFMDFIGRQNVIAANTGLTVVPAKDLTVRLSYHAFWLEDRADALYNAGGGVLRAPGSFNSSRVGQEIDLYARYVFDLHLAGYVGYSHFIPGDAIEDSGRSNDVDFVYLGFAYTF